MRFWICRSKWGELIDLQYANVPKNWCFWTVVLEKTLAHHFMANRWGNNGNSEKIYFLGLQNHFRWWLQPWNQKTPSLWRKSYDKPKQHIKKQRHSFADKGLSIQSYGFSSDHVWMWELDHKESWVLMNWSFELWCWKRLLKAPWTARRSNQSILKKTSPE